MTSIPENNSVEYILQEMQTIPAGTAGMDYLDYFTRNMVEICNLSSCCIYEIHQRGSHNELIPVSFHSVAHSELLDEVFPGKLLMEVVLDKGSIKEKRPSHPIWSQDDLLVIHRAQAVLGILIRDMDNQPLGLLLYVANDANINMDDVESVSEHFCSHLNAELERLVLRKYLNKTHFVFY